MLKGYLCLEGVNHQGHAHKEVGREFGQVLPESADVCIHLLHATRVDKVTAGSLIDVPWRQQTQRALPNCRLQEVLQVVQLIQQVAVRQHDTL